MFKAAADSMYKLPRMPMKGDFDSCYVNNILQGEFESDYPGSQHWMWGEITKSMLTALRVCFAMSLLMRSLLKAEDRVVDVPAEKRVVWTGVGPLKEMLDLFGVMCTKAPDFVLGSASSVVPFELTKTTLDDPYIKGILQPVMGELIPDPSAKVAFTAAQLLDPHDDSWYQLVVAAQASSPPPS
ncbi:hypothetical protein PG988_001355 [Apiospora saccharicola]